MKKSVVHLRNEALVAEIWEILILLSFANFGGNLERKFRRVDGK